MAIIVLRDSDRGTNDYKQGDIVDIMEDTRYDEAGNLVRREPALPPAPPFWYVRVAGATKTQLQFLADVEYNADGTISKKRLWQLRQQSVPAAIKNYFLAHGFCGFGNPEDVAHYSATVAGDTVIQWSDARTWMFNKTAKTTA